MLLGRPSRAVRTRSQVKEVARWRDRYRSDYTAGGVLQGRYYDAGGAPTAEVTKVARWLRQADKIDADTEQERQQFPGCNSRWAQGVGGELWCDEDPVTGRPRYPRQMFSTIQQTTRCVCVTAELLAASVEGTGKGQGLFAVPPQCDPAALRCATPP